MRHNMNPILSSETRTDMVSRRVIFNIRKALPPVSGNGAHLPEALNSPGGPHQYVRQRTAATPVLWLFALGWDAI